MSLKCAELHALLFRLKVVRVAMTSTIVEFNASFVFRIVSKNVHHITLLETQRWFNLPPFDIESMTSSTLQRQLANFMFIAWFRSCLMAGALMRALTPRSRTRVIYFSIANFLAKHTPGWYKVNHQQDREQQNRRLIYEFNRI